MSKHTPGPWEVVDSFYPSMKEVAGPSFNVKAVMWATDLTERDYQERLADLRLIAAAPELLEAATKALGALNAVHIQCDVACVVEPEGEIYLRPVIHALRQIIAKATGEQA